MLVFVCDVCWACRNSVRQVVERQFELVDFREASTIAQVIRRVGDSPEIDLVIVDPFAEGDDWPTLLSRLSNRLPDVPITIFSMNSNRGDILRAIECGAKGYIHKSAEGDAIADALARIMAGEIWLSNEAFRAAGTSDEARSGGPNRSADGTITATVALSKREIELLELLAQGVTNAGMADLLGLSINTVRVYISGILRKLGLCDRTQAALYGVKMLADREN